MKIVWRPFASGISAVVGTFPYRVSAYGAPIAIGLASLVALVRLQNHNPLEGVSPFGISSLAQRAELDAAFDGGPWADTLLGSTNLK